MVSSKNGEAIENVGNEIDKETKYMLPISRKYNRTQIVNGTKIKEPAQYKGLVCLPLGKQNNIQDFKDFLYKRFLRRSTSAPFRSSRTILIPSFDDSFEFLGKRTTGGLKRRIEVPQCTQVGNAVPPLLARAVALEIIKVL